MHLEFGIHNYISGDEEEQRELSHLISKPGPSCSKRVETSTTTKPTFVKHVAPSLGSSSTLSTVECPMPPRNFSLLTEEQYKSFGNVMQFSKCSVNIYTGSGDGDRVSVKKRKRVIIDSDSSQEK